MTGIDDLHGIVLAGGQGRRLRSVTERFEGRPLPKQFCRFGRRQSLLEETLARTTPLVERGSLRVVTQRSQQTLAYRQAAPFGSKLLAQPCDRGTGTAILWAVSEIANESPDDLVLLVPSDHSFASADAFVDGVRQAARQLRTRDGGVILFGAEPEHAATDYGWIVPSTDADPTSVRPVHSFVEKPARSIAEDLVVRGALWNTMVVLGRARDLLQRFRTARPYLVILFEWALRSPVPSREIDALYRRIGACDFSHDVLTHTDDLLCAGWSSEARWSDLGTPLRLHAWLEDAAMQLTA